jgi:hypothetical protein
MLLMGIFQAEHWKDSVRMELMILLFDLLRIFSRFYSLIYLFFYYS